MYKPKLFLTSFILILTMLACQWTGTPTVATHTDQATVQSTAIKTSTFNEYYNSDYGVHIHYQKGWTTKLAKDGYVILFMSAKQDIYSFLWIGPVSDKDTTQSLVKTTVESFSNDYTNVEIVQDSASKVGNNLAAWTFSPGAERGPDTVQPNHEPINPGARIRARMMPDYGL